MGQERLGPSYFFISLVLGPLNSLLWYVPFSRYMELGSYFLFLQEQINDIIIKRDGEQIVIEYKFAEPVFIHPHLALDYFKSVLL